MLTVFRIRQECHMSKLCLIHRRNGTDQCCWITEQLPPGDSSQFG
ncbi:Uncharacterised protein [Vibrio cholerae]|nr:Uncharacterised protein [Vibrio cholerae]